MPARTAILEISDSYSGKAGSVGRRKVSADNLIHEQFYMASGLKLCYFCIKQYVTGLLLFILSPLTKLQQLQKLFQLLIIFEDLDKLVEVF